MAPGSLARGPSRVLRIAAGVAPDGPWATRWSVGFYLTSRAWRRHMVLAQARQAPRRSTSPSSSAVGLAPCLQGYGLPPAAGGLRALQPGGWLAARYAAGEPWPLLSEALGKPVLPAQTGVQPSGVYHMKRRRTAGGARRPATRARLQSEARASRARLAA